MADRQTLLDLAKRCEEAIGPSLELDCRIHHALHPDQRILTDPGSVQPPGRPATYGPLGAVPLDGWTDWQAMRSFMGARPVTASLDAAITLVPTGWAPELSSNPIHGGLLKFEYQCQVRRWVGSSEDRPYLWCWDKIAISKASTPALALTAAALRALAAMEEDTPA